MTEDTFNRELLQAVNDWQRGGDHKQKTRRGKKLKELAENIPLEFRTYNLECFRQEAHEKDRLWKLLADEHLDEDISAWTTSLEIAKEIKGGVPPKGYQGIIFTASANEYSVILNLEKLYNSEEFNRSIEKYKHEIDYYSDGIGRYNNTQYEIILDVPKLVIDNVYSYGGFSSSREKIAELYFGKSPSIEDFTTFNALCDQASIQFGAWWLSPEATQNVMKRIAPQISSLRQAKASTMPPNAKTL